MDTKEKIIKEYEKVELVEVRPSYAVIARKLGVSKSYVFQVVKEYLERV